MALPLNLDLFAFTIPAGQSLSGNVGMGADTIAAISMPATWTAAPLTFQASVDGGVTWQEVYDGNGNEVTVQAAAGQVVFLANYPTYVWRGINNLKIRSGSFAAPVAQAGGAVLTVVGRPEMF